MNVIAYRLKFIMGDLSARKFSERLGMSPTTVQEYLKGRTPPADFIERVCVCFGVEAWWLLTGEGEMMRAPATATREPEAQYIQPGSGDPQIREMVEIMLDLDETSRADLLRQARKELQLQRLIDTNQVKSELIDALESRTSEQLKKLKNIAPEAAEVRKKRGTVTTTKPKKVSR